MTTAAATAPAGTRPSARPAAPAGADRSAREVYRDTIAGLLPAEDRLVVLDSDTGLFSGVDFQGGRERYLNLGIAEHTLMGAAAGLAREGRIPVVNTMAAFAASRALEAVKLDIALGGLPVLIAATHSGVSAGHLGPTHHALEDLASMRVLPRMTVVVPGDAAQTAELLRQALASGGPVYFRLGRGATPALPAGAGPVRLGEAQILRRGTDITLAACGPYPVLAALEAAELLAADGVSANVLHLHTVKPLDTPALLEALGDQRTVITVEEHWAAGGFGSAVAEELSARRPVQVHRIAMPDAFVPVAGGQRLLLERAGVSARSVAESARRALGTSQGGTR
ncbi:MULTISPECIES: transketolase family protein [Streptomyces]|uniref:Transketolase C-terminal domain-containing protein n=2 Tax=Streptomyces TaxID=1883 RepID=A0ABU2RD18_9ACTN|nr:MULTISPECIES: transketolase C-terminal domain-containing protein [unclassified Streptomyces]MBK3594489.1 transketolase [Streptomyces sp. MBT51]MDT0426766.1 transketolase C-terminal domain-containing protein [Streptomyces sp. DSM 41770]